MSSKPLPTDLPIYTFSNAKEFENFLEREHTTAPGFYIKFAKKASGIPTVSIAEAIEVALCFGWIDGRGNGIDDTWYTIRYTPRRAKSIWSQRNVNTIGRLIEEGRLRPAGLAVVEAAKADGRWDRAYAGPATITVPDDLTAALTGNPAAESFFNSLNKTDRYAVLWRVETASPKGRAKCIERLVQKLAVGESPHIVPKSKSKSAQQKNTASKKEESKSPAVKGASIKKSKSGTKLVEKPDIRQPRRTGLRPRP